MEELPELANTHLELPLKRSWSNSYMPKCLSTWRNWYIRPFSRMQQKIIRVAPWKVIGTKGLGSSRWTADEHSDATSPRSKPWATQNNLSPLQGARPLPKSVSTQTREAEPKTTQIVPTTTRTNSNPNNRIAENANTNDANNRNNKKPRPICPPCETCGKTNHPTEKW